MGCVFIVDCLGEMSYVCMTLMYYLLLRARALVVFGLVALVSRLALSLSLSVRVCQSVCVFVWPPLVSSDCGTDYYSRPLMERNT